MKSHHPLPGYATPLSAGMDIRANLTEPVMLKPLERKLIPTGLYIARCRKAMRLENRCAPRSGPGIEAWHHIAEHAGYYRCGLSRGEIGIILINLSSNRLPSMTGSVFVRW